MKRWDVQDDLRSSGRIIIFVNQVAREENKIDRMANIGGEEERRGKIAGATAWANGAGHDFPLIFQL